MKVDVGKGESISSAIKRFKMKCLKEGIIQEMKKREFHKTPSMLRKEKLAVFKRKKRRKQQKKK